MQRDSAESIDNSTSSVMTSPSVSKPSPESTPAYANGPVVQVPIPPSLKTNPETIESVLTTVMSVISLAFHLWKQTRSREK